jgi:hypothetical protein
MHHRPELSFYKCGRGDIDDSLFRLCSLLRSIWGFSLVNSHRQPPYRGKVFWQRNILISQNNYIKIELGRRNPTGLTAATVEAFGAPLIEI